MSRIKKLIATIICASLVLTSFTALESNAKNDRQTVFSAEDMFGSSQTGSWHYLTRKVVGNIYEELTYDAENKAWTDGKGGVIGKDFMHSSSDSSATQETQIVLQFECPYTGKIDILDKKGYVSVSSDTTDGVKLCVWKNSTSMMETIIDASDKYREAFKPISTTVKVGDKINIILGFNGDNSNDATQISPVINYTKIDNSVVSSDDETGKESPKYAFKGAEGKTVYDFGKMFSSSQDGPWHYMVRENVTNTYSEMTYNSETKQWTDGKGGMIDQTAIATSADASANHEMQTCLQFEAPNSGKITIYSRNGLLSLSGDSENGITAGTFHNSTMIFGYEDIQAGEDYGFKPITVDVVEGDKISFVFSAKNGNNASDVIFFHPVIVYETKKPSLSSQVSLPKKGTEADGVYEFKAAFDDTQGPVWYYLQREVVSNEYRELKYQSESWVDSFGGMISRDLWHSTVDASANHEWTMCAQFRAPREGNITIYSGDGLCTVASDSNDGVRIAVLHNNNMALGYTDIGPGEKYIFKPITLNVDEGDNISFILSMGKNNEADGTMFNPVVVYNAYEKIIEEVEIEVREDDPSQTVYKSFESYGAYVNPWYYRYWKDGASTLADMGWNTVNKNWNNEEETSCLLLEKEAHPGVSNRAVRVFKAPKSGYVDIDMLDDVIELTSPSFADVADGVYVSILLYDGASTTTLMKSAWLYPGDGQKLAFERLENIHIYKGWEIWFVTDKNINNANDAVKFAPIVTYTQITDEEAPVYLNSEEELKKNNEYFKNEKNHEESEKAGKTSMELWMNLLGVLTVLVIAAVILVIRRRRSK